MPPCQVFITAYEIPLTVHFTWYQCCSRVSTFFLSLPRRASQVMLYWKPLSRGQNVKQVAEHTGRALLCPFPLLWYQGQPAFIHSPSDICVFCRNPPRAVRMHPLTSDKDVWGVYCPSNVTLSMSLTDQQQVTFDDECRLLVTLTLCVRQAKNPKWSRMAKGLLGGFKVTDSNTKGNLAYLDMSQRLLCSVGM